MKYQLEAIQKITGGSLMKANQELPAITDISLDTRQIHRGEHSLFVAIRGPFHDGHDHIAAAYEKGVRHFLVSRPPAPELAESAHWLFVSDTTRALQRIAAAHRAGFGIPVIGITGSNGKTWVKEWLFQLLGDQFHIVRSPKSYNSQIGVPLSVLAMQDAHELAIFEAGISQPGEMAHLAGIIRPTVGVFTVLGDAHSAHFSSEKEKLDEKWQLFSGAASVVYCADQAPVHDFAVQRKDTPLLCWSASGHPASDVQLSYRHSRGQTQIDFSHEKYKGSVSLPFESGVACWNASTCIAVLIALGIDPGRLASRFAALEPIGMRMELVQGRGGAILVNDAYNADMEGLKQALAFTRAHSGDRECWAAISALPEAGGKPEDQLGELAEQLRLFDVKRVFGVGGEIAGLASLLGEGIRFEAVDSGAELETRLSAMDLSGAAILFKAARSYRLDRVCSALEQVTHLTELEIHLDALRHNLAYYRRQLRPGTQLIAVVKAAAYGIGSQEIARFLEVANIDRLAVAYTDEGVELRKLGVKTPILVLNPDPSGFEWMLHYRLEPEIYSLTRLREWLRTIEMSPYQTAVHLKLETGMNRLGFDETMLPDLCAILRDNPALKVAAVMTHLAASENPAHDAFSRGQLARFEQMYRTISDALGYKPSRHVLNSNGILRFPEYHFEAVRLGIGLYGVGVASSDLRPVHRLVSRIAQIKQVKAGETVGYDRSYVAERDCLSATINLGYADGLPRSAGKGKFHLMVKGQLCPILGNVCMDMTMIDVTHVPEVREGDEVIVFGSEHPMALLSKAAETIPYEILTGIGPRVKRRFINE